MSRYARQIALPLIGSIGQEKLSQSHVVIIGCGGLGSIVAPYLAGAGVGHMTLVDFDIVSEANLHRQVFYKERDIGSNKAKALARHIKALNSTIEVTSSIAKITKENVDSFLRQANVVIECTDDIWTKYLINDYCAVNGIAMVYGALQQSSGYISTFSNHSQSDTNLRDVFPVPDTSIPKCSEVGVLGMAAGIIGLMQASEAIKYLVNHTSKSIDHLITIDLSNLELIKIRLKKNYSENIEDLYSNSDYKSLPNVPQISVEDILSDASYQVYSLVEVPKQTTIIEVKKIKEKQYPILTDNAVIVCNKGKKSLEYVKVYKALYPDQDIYSLKGGWDNILSRNN